ncbi:MAG: M56 family metallopeptidase [Oscillospiraceae bacterium]|nr:M56 family metallopeptidase [Oscillospiraceae bacterium]
MLLAAALAMLRFILPLDFQFTYVLESRKVIPSIRDLLRDHRWALPLLMAVWGLGTAAVLARDVYALIAAYVSCRGYRAVEDPRVDEIAERLSVNCPVLVSPDVEVPYVSGLFRHRIYLSDQELSDRELELVLLHERQHIRSFDSQIKLFWGLLSAVLWWNPIVYKFREEIDALLEFRCDAKVTEHMGTEERVEYLHMLLKIMRRVAAGPRRSALTLNESAALNSSCIAQQRFEVIMDNLDKKPNRIGFLVKVLLVVVFLASYLVIAQPVIAVPIDEYENQIQLASGQRIESDEIVEALSSVCIIKIDGHYYLFSDGWQGIELSPDEVFSEPYKDYIILEECIP